MLLLKVLGHLRVQGPFGINLVAAGADDDEEEEAREAASGASTAQHKCVTSTCQYSFGLYYKGQSLSRSPQKRHSGAEARQPGGRGWTNRQLTGVSSLSREDFGRSALFASRLHELLHAGVCKITELATPAPSLGPGGQKWVALVAPVLKELRRRYPAMQADSTSTIEAEAEFLHRGIEHSLC